MAEARSLAVQSILFGNSSRDIERAAEAVATSARFAVAEGLISSWEYIVGDCSSQAVFALDSLDALRLMIEAEGGGFTYEFFDENLGSAAGHNRLAEASASDLMIILNPDAVMAPDTIAVLARSTAADVGVVESRQLPLEHPKDYDALTGETSWASTACAMTPRHLFERLGGFDAATFFLYCDDVDYSWRARLADYRVLYAPAARLFHDKRLTTSGDWPASSAEIYYSAEAAILLAAKFSRPELAAELVAQFDAEGGAAAKAATEFRRRSAAGLLAESIDSDHGVGQFIGGNYAIHRF